MHIDGMGTDYPKNWKIRVFEMENWRKNAAGHEPGGAIPCKAFSYSYLFFSLVLVSLSSSFHVYHDSINA